MTQQHKHVSLNNTAASLCYVILFNYTIPRIVIPILYNNVQGTYVMSNNHGNVLNHLFLVIDQWRMSQSLLYTLHHSGT